MDISGAGCRPGRILVFEKQPQWCPELRRRLTQETCRVLSCQSPAEVRTELVEADQAGCSAVVVIDLSGGVQGVLALVSHVRRCHGVRLVVLGHPEDLPLEPVVRELGADSFLLLPVPGETVAAACCRLMRSAAKG